jgi:hypothetical protein
MRDNADMDRKESVCDLENVNSKVVYLEINHKVI